MVKLPVKLTFEEYLTYDAGTDNRYELVDGELVMVPLPTADHSDVIDLLADVFRAEIGKRGYPWIVKRDVGLYTRTDPNTGKDRSRTPDVCVMTSVQWAELKAEKTKSAVLKTPPLLVVEIVSSGSQKTDYTAKELEYARVKIPEYWIVDLRHSKISVLLLVGDSYQAMEYTESQAIISQVFPELMLPVGRVLNA